MTRNTLVPAMRLPAESKPTDRYQGNASAAPPLNNIYLLDFGWCPGPDVNPRYRFEIGYCTGLPATVAAGAADFNWSSAVCTPSQRAWSFLVAMDAEGSE